MTGPVVTRPAARTRDQRGAVTVIALGLALGLLLLGGIAIDGGRALEARRSLAAQADAAARAGANGIDEAAARRGVLRLDPQRVRHLVARSLAAQRVPGIALVALEVSPADVRVVLRQRVALTLGRLAGTRRPITVTVSARAAPRVVP